MESFLSLVGKSYLCAKSLTSFLVKWPIGNKVLANWLSVNWLKKYVWSLLSSIPLNIVGLLPTIATLA